MRSDLEATLRNIQFCSRFCLSVSQRALKLPFCWVFTRVRDTDLTKGNMVGIVIELVGIVQLIRSRIRGKIDLSIVCKHGLDRWLRTLDGEIHGWLQHIPLLIRADVEVLV